MTFKLKIIDVQKYPDKFKEYKQQSVLLLELTGNEPFWKENPEAFNEELRREKQSTIKDSLDRDNPFIAVAVLESGKKVVGGLYIQEIKSLNRFTGIKVNIDLFKDKPLYRLMNPIIIEEQRGKGLGNFLLKSVITHYNPCFATDMRSIESRKLYESVGYKKVGFYIKRTNNGLEKIDIYYLSKTINTPPSLNW